MDVTKQSYDCDRLNKEKNLGISSFEQNFEGIIRKKVQEEMEMFEKYFSFFYF